MNAAYASDLRDLIAAARPHLWIHGHTHDSCEYRIPEARVVYNRAAITTRTGRSTQPC